MKSKLNIKELWERVPEFFRFAIVGLFGLSIGIMVYSLIYYINPLTNFRATTSWIFSSILAVLRQHFLHWKFTFGNEEINYFVSVLGAFKAYSLGISLSTLANFIIVEYYEFSHYVAWVASIIVAMCVNFFMLKKYSFNNP